MKLFLVCFAAMSLVLSVAGQPTNPMPLWEGDAPGALGHEQKDIPTLTAFLPDPTNATGAAMVICPGGGYARLADHEGKTYALWLNAQGIAGFVLKYRLGSAGYRHPVMLQDASRALRMVRSHAAEWKLDPQRIGIMGSSAGGHLASTLVTHFDAGNPDATNEIDRVSSRPDLGVLCYPVITMQQFTHGGSRQNLLGDHPDPKLVEDLSNEQQVTSNTPPCFLFHTAADKTVPVENSLMFAMALAKNHVPFALAIYESGGHGMGLGTHEYEPAKFHPWTHDCEVFLKEHHFAK